jgi:hypothetical protein
VIACSGKAAPRPRSGPGNAALDVAVIRVWRGTGGSGGRHPDGRSRRKAQSRPLLGIMSRQWRRGLNYRGVGSLAGWQRADSGWRAVRWGCGWPVGGREIAAAMLGAESALSRSAPGAAQVQGDGEQLQLEGVVDQGAVAHAAIAVPALQDREGALDRRPDRPDGPPDRCGIDLAKEPLERRPVDQRRDPLQLPVASRAACDQARPPGSAAPARAASTPPAAFDRSHRITNQRLCKALHGAGL